MPERWLPANYRKPLVCGCYLSLAVIAGLGIFLPSYLRLRRLRQEHKRVLIRIDGVKREIEELNDNLLRVEKDPYILERIAREHIGVVKDNEIVIDIQD